MVIPPLPLFLLSLPFYSSPFSFFLRFPSPLIPLEATCLSLAMTSPGIQYGYRNGVGPPPMVAELAWSPLNPPLDTTRDAVLTCAQKPT